LNDFKAYFLVGSFGESVKLAGRPLFPVNTMLPIHCLKLWLNPLGGRV